MVPPFYHNFGKRLVKSPKVYLADSGLACHTVAPSAARSLLRLDKTSDEYEVERLVAYQPLPDMPNLSALCPGVRAVSVEGLLDHLTSSQA